MVESGEKLLRVVKVGKSWKKLEKVDKKWTKSGQKAVKSGEKW